MTEAACALVEIDTASLAWIVGFGKFCPQALNFYGIKKRDRPTLPFHPRDVTSGHFAWICRAVRSGAKQRDTAENGGLAQLTVSQ